MNATGNNWYYESWSLILYESRLRLFFDEKLVKSWPLDPLTKLCCRFQDTDLLMVIFNDGKFSLVTFDLDSKTFKNADIVSVDYKVSKFEVMWERGIILVADGISGCLYCIDTHRRKNLGYIQTNMIGCNDIYPVDEHSFQVFVSKFDKHTMTNALYLNTYVLQANAEDSIGLGNSIVLNNSLDKHWIIRKGDAFGIISCSPLVNESMIELYVDHSTAPFISQHFPNMTINAAQFLDDAWSLVLVTNSIAISLYRPLDLAIVDTVELKDYGRKPVRVRKSGEGVIDETLLQVNEIAYEWDGSIEGPDSMRVVVPEKGTINNTENHKTEEESSGITLLTAQKQQICALFAGRANTIFKFDLLEGPSEQLRDVFLCISLPENIIGLAPKRLCFTDSDRCYSIK
ncbi:HER159Wp [Eremothecium sinecaudum]|uniref:HER159Wp n=1 Tax=Eremothecium sinecaudum TaxID=45286 RepID=A0A109UZW6_9SACH|nr:HER159Wp [Eremothecium sinecaudum]AMD21438.1 HER159Wp [Eremothecium sinecaudum]